MILKIISFNNMEEKIEDNILILTENFDESCLNELL